MKADRKAEIRKMKDDELEKLLGELKKEKMKFEQYLHLLD